MTNNPCLRPNYTLRADSPCIDAGLKRAWMNGATDLAGASRVRSGYSRGKVDMGCFESNGSVGTVLLFK